MEDFIAGLIGGTIGLTVGHPLDTIKALMQTKNHPSMFTSAKILLNETRLTGFFRGLSLPFISYGPINAIIFGIYGNSLRLLEKNASGEKTNTGPSLSNVFIAGSLAGFISTIPNNPLEVVKIQLQTHNKTEINGARDCLRQIIKHHGYRGFFKGLNVLLSRDTFSYGFYFTVFEYLRRKSLEAGHNSQIFIDLVCGGFAGSLAWFVIMPIDVIKSRIQSEKIKNKTFKEEFGIITKEFGLKGHFKGTGPVFLRGFLVNSITFCGYRQTLELIG